MSYRTGHVVVEVREPRRIVSVDDLGERRDPVRQQVIDVVDLGDPALFGGTPDRRDPVDCGELEIAERWRRQRVHDRGLLVDDGPRVP
ncbi:hypothetical protein GCM10009836_24370 [Pseudonocardia ailaonensis]|uniref:Uncharacterized protein n=1 Tax=Pseudonocardia ailaonensis TaxID=367279 RepID=A0ABN2MYW5_9PSEU